ncbi:unnamed protein product [Rotaria magnacalcarata]|nr:unnamed protein product [Rotaria magnacalcarata]
MTSSLKTMPNSSDSNEVTLEIPVWVSGKRKWVTGITKKTTFEDLIYALLAQADLLKSSDMASSSSNSSIAGYAIAECIQSTPSSTESAVSQHIFKGRSKVIKANKNWHFDKLPLTILQLIPTSSLTDHPNNSSTTKLRSKLFRRFLSPKEINQDESFQQKLLNNYQENINILERQKRLLNYLDEQIHQVEKTSSKSNPIVSLNDVSHLLTSKPIQQEQLILATQLCNSIFNIQEHIDEKTNVLHGVEQAISNELNLVLHQQHYDVLPITITDNSNSSSNDLLTLKNSIYRSRELSRIQSKEMHDLDLSLREAEILLGSKYDELKYLEYETSSNSMIRSRSLTPNINLAQKITIDEQRPQQSAYDTLELAFNSMKEADEDSGINSLTSDDSNHHSMSMINQKLSNTQLETLV